MKIKLLIFLHSIKKILRLRTTNIIHIWYDEESGNTLLLTFGRSGIFTIPNMRNEKESIWLATMVQMNKYNLLKGNKYTIYTLDGLA